MACGWSSTCTPRHRPAADTRPTRDLTRVRHGIEGVIMELQAAPAGLSKFSPPELPKPLGCYSHIGVAKGVDIVAIAGQVSVDLAGAFVAEGDVYGQTVQAYANLHQALACVGLGLEDLVKCNAYVVGAD